MVIASLALPPIKTGEKRLYHRLLHAGRNPRLSFANRITVSIDLYELVFNWKRISIFVGLFL
jgi:hypothetical protein